LIKDGVANMLGNASDECVVCDDSGKIICDYSEKTASAYTIPSTQVMNNVEPSAARDMAFYNIMLLG